MRISLPHSVNNEAGASSERTGHDRCQIKKSGCYEPDKTTTIKAIYDLPSQCHGQGVKVCPISVHVEGTPTALNWYVPPAGQLGHFRK